MYREVYQKVSPVPEEGSAATMAHSSASVRGSRTTVVLRSVSVTSTYSRVTSEHEQVSVVQAGNEKALETEGACLVHSHIHIKYSNPWMEKRAPTFGRVGVGCLAVVMVSSCSSGPHDSRLNGAVCCRVGEVSEQATGGSRDGDR